MRLARLAFLPRMMKYTLLLPSGLAVASYNITPTPSVFFLCVFASARARQVSMLFVVIISVVVRIAHLLPRVRSPARVPAARRALVHLAQLAELTRAEVALQHRRCLSCQGCLCDVIGP